MPPGPSPAQTARVIHLALMAAVTLTVTVFLVLPRQEVRPEIPALLYLTFGLGALCYTWALVLAGRLARDPGPPEAGEWWRENLPRALFIWSLLDGPALVGAVVYYLLGDLLPLVVTGVGLGLFVLTTPERLRGE